MNKVEARCIEASKWGVYIDGQLVSTHVGHVAARRAAQGHLAPIDTRGAG